MTLPEGVTSTDGLTATPKPNRRESQRPPEGRVTVFVTTVVTGYTSIRSRLGRKPDTTAR